MSEGVGLEAQPGSFEEAYRGLQETVARLEHGGLGLQEAIETFERGIELANRCAAILDAAELRVTRVLESQQLGSEEPAF